MVKRLFVENISLTEIAFFFGKGNMSKQSTWGYSVKIISSSLKWPNSEGCIGDQTAPMKNLLLHGQNISEAPIVKKPWTLTLIYCKFVKNLKFSLKGGESAGFIRIESKEQILWWWGEGIETLEGWLIVFTYLCNIYTKNKIFLGF